MTEVTEFLDKLQDSDLLVVTTTSERAYCRFFSGGLYFDRMYLTDPALLAELLPLIGEGDEIDATGITRLKQYFLASDTSSAVDTV